MDARGKIFMEWIAQLDLEVVNELGIAIFVR